MKRQIDLFAQMILECENIVFFGGAGTSTESGVKDYRSQDGLYHTVQDYGVPPEVILSRSFFFQHPDIFYDFYRKYFLIDAKPNDAHKSLAELERIGKLKVVITQNIDGLHQKAGSENVIELHGTANEFACCNCQKETLNTAVISEIKKGKVPKCSYCSGVMKPKVVLYEEPLYDGVAEYTVSCISQADMLIVGGTSLSVYPAASFVEYFKGKYIVMINKSETGFDSKANLVISERIGEVFKEVMKLL